MKSGSVIVDMAASRGATYEGNVGGNCPLTETDKVVVKHGVTIVGFSNLAALMPADASAFYARNLFEFLKLIVTKEGSVKIDLGDEIVASTLLTHEGQISRKF
jgi:NAD(P) transhydrogenase subunit alpha